MTATRGERGRFGRRGKGGDPVEIGCVREAELRRAAAVLGIGEVSMLGYPDGGVDRVAALPILGRSRIWQTRWVFQERLSCSVLPGIFPSRP